MTLSKTPDLQVSADEQPKFGAANIGVKYHLAFTLLSMLALMAMYSILRLALLVYNSEQIGSTPASMIAEAFFNGLRFDLRLVMIGCIPLLLALLSMKALQARGLLRLWLTLFASSTLFLGLVELDFYREFNQRLNGLVFQYLKEDPKTVLSMLWFGFPVLRYLLAWALATWFLVILFRKLDLETRPPSSAHAGIGNLSTNTWYVRIPVLILCLLLAAIAARGTLRQGSPLRWGDAFTTESMFANQLGLNGTLSLAAAAQAQMSAHRDNAWKGRLPQAEALAETRKMLMTGSDTPVDPDRAAVRRDYTPPAEGVLPIRNVVLILMESLAGHSVGVLGAPSGITPYFDKLAAEGVLFNRFFSNGTHTHQGMFASIGCFPNLPGFEYLMKTPESGNKFSGLPQLLGARNFDNLFVYNGDFAWDNQSGFFGKQGVSNFIGRLDFVDPVVFDPTWGVSDQDMFDRATEELEKKSGGKPFYALLQTLSNHTPYPIPDKLPVEPVTGHGSLDQHLTAMRYADWALGQFFEKARKAPYFKETLFVIVGDHGFGNNEQLTEMNLARFNVPLLLIGPGIQKKFGNQRDTVGTQVDIVPTIMGRLGGKVRHQCWGRDLLNLPQGDPGFGVIKPSGGEQIVAIISGDKILIGSRTTEPKVYQYQLGEKPKAIPIEKSPDEADLKHKLEAFLQTATKSLLENTAGASAN
jgi:phosphoglycerol transferase MdoB-like AlkP superfamily enzyme